jgi:hypothetical protein
MTDPFKRCLIDLLSSLSAEEERARTGMVLSAMREARQVLGMVPLSNEDMSSHLLVTSAEILADHCRQEGLDGCTLDLVDPETGESGPLVAVSIDAEVSEALRMLMDASQSDELGDFEEDDTEEEDTEVTAPGNDWEN